MGQGLLILDVTSTGGWCAFSRLNSGVVTASWRTKYFFHLRNPLKQITVWPFLYFSGFFVVHLLQYEKDGKLKEFDDLLLVH